MRESLGRRARAKSRGVAIAAASLAVSVAGVSIIAADASGAPSLGIAGHPLTPTLTAELSQGVDQHVIVIMNSQPAATTAGSAAQVSRSAAIAADQAPLMRELSAVHATDVKQYGLVNSFAATISKGEESRLRADPAVAEVIADVTIQGALPDSATPTASSSSDSPDLTPNVLPGACSAMTPQLDPEGLSLTNTDSDNPSQPTARSLGITGSGVKVAWIADGIDPNNINFIRSRQHVRVL